MSTIENDQVMTASGDKTAGFWKKPVILISAIIILVLAATSVAGYFVWNHVRRNQGWMGSIRPLWRLVW